MIFDTVVWVLKVSSPGARTSPGRPAPPDLCGFSGRTAQPGSVPGEGPAAAPQTGQRKEPGGQTLCEASCTHGRSPWRRVSTV